MDLHEYVCLAVLRQCKESLEELEHSEIKSFLQKLPHINMDELINEAYNLRHESSYL